MNPNREELAWAAGFFDGEGSVRSAYRYRTTRTPQPFLQITQVDRRPLQRFAQAVGVGTIYGPLVRADAPNRKPYHIFAAMSFQNVQSIMAMLWPFLCELKREQFRRTYRRDESDK